MKAARGFNIVEAKLRQMAMEYIANQWLEIEADNINSGFGNYAKSLDEYIKNNDIKMTYSETTDGSRVDAHMEITAFGELDARFTLNIGR